MIYIVTSSKITGGPELLHQCAYYLDKYFPNEVKVFYTDGADNIGFFGKYIKETMITSSIIDNDKNILIVPETFTQFLRGYSKINKVVWWLSFDNYFLNYGMPFFSVKARVLMLLRRLKRRYVLKYNPLKINELKNVEYHWFQSYYAKNLLNRLGFKGVMVGDFLEGSLIKNTISDRPRENNILYNPAKGYRETKKIIDFFKVHCLGENYNFIPLIGLNRGQLKGLLQNSKIYLDFGYHPGKDRMPREAAANGCVVITNKKGSAGYESDVPIKDEYKFSTLKYNDLVNLTSLIDDILINYEIHNQNQRNYLESILEEERVFERDLLNAIKSIKKHNES